MTENTKHQNENARPLAGFEMAKRARAFCEKHGEPALRLFFDVVDIDDEKERATVAPGGGLEESPELTALCDIVPAYYRELATHFGADADGATLEKLVDKYADRLNLFCDYQLGEYWEDGADDFDKIDASEWGFALDGSGAFCPVGRDTYPAGVFRISGDYIDICTFCLQWRAYRFPRFRLWPYQWADGERPQKHD